MTPDETFFTFSSFHWISAYVYMIFPIMRGTKRIITFRKPDPATIVEIFQKHQVNHCFLATTFAGALINYISKSQEKITLPSLKVVASGGSRVSQKIRAGFKSYLPHVIAANLYGLSETGAISSGLDQLENSHYVGKLLPNIQGKVLVSIFPFQGHQIKSLSSRLLIKREET